MQIYVRQYLYLLASEFRPFSTLEHLIKLKQILSAEEVDEPIPHIALILDIARQIKEVIGVIEAVIDLFRELFDGVFVRDVSDHHSSAYIQQDVIKSQQKHATLFSTSVAVVAIGKV